MTRLLRRAARARRRSTRAARRGGGCAFEPIIVETYGRLGEPAFTLLERLAHIAAESCKVDKDLFMANTPKEMSVGLCWGTAMILAAGQQLLAKVTGFDV